MFKSETGEGQKKAGPVAESNGSGAASRRPDFRHVRAEFVRRGSSLAAWSRARGYSAQLVGMALSGQRKGPLSRRICREIAAETGILTVDV